MLSWGKDPRSTHLDVAYGITNRSAKSRRERFRNGIYNRLYSLDLALVGSRDLSIQVVQLEPGRTEDRGGLAFGRSGFI